MNMFLVQKNLQHLKIFKKTQRIRRLPSGIETLFFRQILPLFTHLVFSYQFPAHASHVNNTLNFTNYSRRFQNMNGNSNGMNNHQRGPEQHQRGPDQRQRGPDQNQNRPNPRPNLLPNLAPQHLLNHPKKQFAPIPYRPEDENRIQKALNKVLGPEYVSFRPGGGGQNVSYIEGWKALNLANEIFGFNGWSSELISVQVDFMDSHGSGRVSLGLSVVVRITIRDGTYHEDFGYGFIENAKNKAMAFEKCKKEAFTDGMKRCLRCFGNVLGNCLYDKTIIAKMQKVKLPAPELESDDFHRDPLVVKREREKQRRADTLAPPPRPVQHIQQQAREPADVTPAVVKGYDLEDFDDLFVFSDDLPDDRMDDGELNDRLDDYELDLLNRREEEKPDERPMSEKPGEGPTEKPGEGPTEIPELEKSASENSDKSDKPEVSRPVSDKPEPTPSQVFFTSSKKALDVQKALDQNGIPVYDHKFVASSVRRTIDPSKSTKIRRADLPTALTASQMNRGRVASPITPAIGKRPLGMPPSQRQQPKRLHRDIGEEKVPEKENGGVEA